MLSFQVVVTALFATGAPGYYSSPVGKCCPPVHKGDNGYLVSRPVCEWSRGHVRLRNFLGCSRTDVRIASLNHEDRGMSALCHHKSKSLLHDVVRTWVCSCTGNRSAPILCISRISPSAKISLIDTQTGSSDCSVNTLSAVGSTRIFIRQYQFVHVQLLPVFWFLQPSFASTSLRYQIPPIHALNTGPGAAIFGKSTIPVRYR